MRHFSCCWSFGQVLEFRPTSGKENLQVSGERLQVVYMSSGEPAVTTARQPSQAQASIEPSVSPVKPYQQDKSEASHPANGVSVNISGNAEQITYRGVRRCRATANPPSPHLFWACQLKLRLCICRIMPCNQPGSSTHLRCRCLRAPCEIHSDSRFDLRFTICFGAYPTPCIATHERQPQHWNIAVGPQNGAIPVFPNDAV